jgi:hypothetical protein
LEKWERGALSCFGIAFNDTAMTVWFLLLLFFKTGGTAQIGFSAQNVLWSSILGNRNASVPLPAAVSLGSH